MTAKIPLIVEIVCLLLIWSLAALLCFRFRRRLRRDSGPAAGALFLDVLAHVSIPLLVLLISQVVVIGLRTWGGVTPWLDANDNHLLAWEIFWLGVAVIGLMEGMVHAAFRRRGRDFPLPDLLADIIRALLVVLVGLAVLRFVLGINIGPVLASTALVTAVVGFALQGVLGNLLAGMSMHLVRTLRPGVWVEVDGIVGKVIKTNWRETRLRTIGGHMYIIPNSTIAGSKVHNYSEPSPLRRHEIFVGASYSDAPDQVIAEMIAAARDVPQVRATPAPDAVLAEFQDYGINYRLTFWTTELHRKALIGGHVQRNIWYRFKRQGIEIPFPMSDKLLNDFMAVVYNQRKLMPGADDARATLDDLLASDLGTKVFVDGEGQALISPDDWAAVAPLVKRQPFTRDETICRQGDAGDTFWVIARGTVQGQVTDGTKVAAQFDLPTGAVVGEMSLLTGAPRSATLKAGDGLELLEFGPRAFGALLALHEDLPDKLAELAAQRAASNKEALEALAASEGQGEKMVLERSGILRRLWGMVGRS